MKGIASVVLLFCMRMGLAMDKPATDAGVQAINASVQQLYAQLQVVNSNLSTLNGEVQVLAKDIRNDYGGLEYVLLALVQALYFGLGLALFYVFDRGRLARDLW